MIRHEFARILHAIADRLEVEKPEPEIQYVYVYSAPPVTTVPVMPRWWQMPWTYGPNTCVAQDVSAPGMTAWN